MEPRSPDGRTRQRAAALALISAQLVLCVRRVGRSAWGFPGLRPAQRPARNAAPARATARRRQRTIPGQRSFCSEALLSRGRSLSLAAKAITLDIRHAARHGAASSSSSKERDKGIPANALRSLLYSLLLLPAEWWPVAAPARNNLICSHRCFLVAEIKGDIQQTIILPEQLGGRTGEEGCRRGGALGSSSDAREFASQAARAPDARCEKYLAAHRVPR